MQARSETTVQPSGGGMPRIGKDVAVVRLGGRRRVLAAAVLPGPVAARLWVVPATAPVLKVPVPVLPSVAARCSGVAGAALEVVGTGPAPEFDVTPEPDASALAWAMPNVMDVVAVYTPAGRAHVAELGNRMVGSPGMKGMSNWCQRAMTSPPALAEAIAPELVSCGSRVRTLIPSWASVALTVCCSCAGLMPAVGAAVVAMCTPVPSM